MKRRRCENCGELVPFVYYVERDGLRMRVCGDDLQHGDKVFTSRTDFYVYTYRTTVRRGTVR